MAVISVRELKERQGSIDQAGKTSYSRVFRVETNDPDDGAKTARIAVGISVGDLYATPNESDSNAYCTSVSANCVSDDGLSWEVTVEYGPLPDNPLTEPVQYAWSFQQFEKPTDFDVFGNAIVNSAGDPFAEAVTKDDSRPVLTITRNEPAPFAADLAYLYRDAINATPYLGAGPGQVKVSNISATSQHDDFWGEYVQVQYEFHFSAEGWDKRILDAGFREKIEGELKNILVQGVPASEPVLLDGNGRKLPSDKPPVVRKYQVYPKAPFSIFPS